MPQRDVHQCQCDSCTGLGPHPDQETHRQMNLLMSRLDEQQRRWYAALESARIGHGGDRLLSRITGLHVDTIRRGREELADDLESRPADRVRLPGGGRPPVEKKSPDLVPTLTGVVESATGGDPMGPTRFVRRSLPAIAADLEVLGHDLCPSTISRLLRERHYSLRVNRKRFTGTDHPDRDRQFRNIDEWIAIFEELGQPIISVDSKKKELIGNFKNAGAAWCLQPEEVNVYDFLKDAECRATPYGIYDLLWGRGHICVGTSSDTPAFAVESIRSWWARYGCHRYPGADELLILADGGGSNGHRPRLWKWALQEPLADRYGLHVTVCHYPTGASKWNPVEHRLFGPVSINWSGQPLRSLETMLGWVRGTEVGGVGVTASLDRREYPKKVKVSDEEMMRLNLERHLECPDWNYTLSPRRPQLLN